jgi:hypothetical protein
VINDSLEIVDSRFLIETSERRLETSERRRQRWGLSIINQESSITNQSPIKDRGIGK